MQRTFVAEKVGEGSVNPSGKPFILCLYLCYRLFKMHGIRKWGSFNQWHFTLFNLGCDSTLKVFLVNNHAVCTVNTILRQDFFVVVAKRRKSDRKWKSLTKVYFSILDGSITFCFLGRFTDFWLHQGRTRVRLWIHSACNSVQKKISKVSKLTLMSTF